MTSQTPGPSAPADPATITGSVLSAVTLLPDWLPYQGRLTFGALAVTRAWANAQGSDRLELLSIGQIPGLSKSQSELVSRAMDALTFAAVATPLVGLVRRLPAGWRVTAAGAVGALAVFGSRQLDARLRQVADAARAKAAEAQETVARAQAAASDTQPAGA